ncbi:Zinc finger BED domain-containing protein 4 [Formica fusca]
MKVFENKKDEMTTILQQVEENPEQSNLWKTHDELVARYAEINMGEENLAYELRQYLKQKVIPRHQDPFNHWKIFESSFPGLYKLAIQYISIISTSVPSERLFSAAGGIKTDDRNRLTGEHLNRLLFLGSLSKEEWRLG